MEGKYESRLQFQANCGILLLYHRSAAAAFGLIALFSVIREFLSLPLPLRPLSPVSFPRIAAAGGGHTACTCPVHGNVQQENSPLLLLQASELRGRARRGDGRRRLRRRQGSARPAG